MTELTISNVLCHCQCIHFAIDVGAHQHNIMTFYSPVARVVRSYANEKCPLNKLNKEVLQIACLKNGTKWHNRMYCIPLIPPSDGPDVLNSSSRTNKSSKQQQHVCSYTVHARKRLALCVNVISQITILKFSIFEFHLILSFTIPRHVLNSFVAKFRANS
jgi:hypothetical protein